MLYNVAIAFVILWVIGLATKFHAGGLIHLLLGIAIGTVLYQLIRGSRA